jgi:phage terminase large subunit-like protein
LGATISIERALATPSLLAGALGDLSSWRTWIAVWKAAFGLQLSADEAVLFAQVSGGRLPPTRRVQAVYAVAGRGSGKSRMAAAVVSYLGACVDYSSRLAAGETGCIIALAPTVAQAKVVFDYCVGFLQSSPILSDLIETVTDDEIRLQGNIVISVHASNFRSVRGRTLLAVVVDEISFLRDEASAIPDVELVRAVTPSLVNGGA